MRKTFCLIFLDNVIFENKKEFTTLILLYNRYYPPKKINEKFTNVKTYGLKTIGYSFTGKEIIVLEFGTGSFQIGAWCGMHGNETTAIRAIDKIFNTSQYENRLQEIVETITFSCILCLNPDGAEAYTRENAQGIDINRDFHNKETPEMVLLQKFVLEHKPIFKLLLNLHDQRSIFHIGPLPASLSILAPSYNHEMEINETRLKAMERIAAAMKLLPMDTHPYISRFTDEYYPTATGDNFTALGFPTVLIESGHDVLSYERNLSTDILVEMIVGIFSSVNEHIQNFKDVYNQIKENETNACDELITDVKIIGDDFNYNCELGLYFKEVLKSEREGVIDLVPVLHKKSQLNKQLGLTYWKKSSAKEYNFPNLTLDDYNNLEKGSPLPFTLYKRQL